MQSVPKQNVKLLWLRHRTTASSILGIDAEKLRYEEVLDGYYVLLTSEMDKSDGEILEYIGEAMDIDFNRRIRTLGEIKKVLADTKK